MDSLYSAICLYGLRVEDWVYYRYDTLDGCCCLDGAP